jgi:TPR repeat protein
MDVPKTIAEAEGGSTVAQAILGISYFHGNGVKQDFGEAFRWLNLAAEREAPRALYHLGVILEQGLCGEIDLARAFDCFLRASLREEVQAYIHVARMLRYGSGTLSDHNAAREWYAKILDEVNRGWTFDYTDEAKEFVGGK